MAPLESETEKALLAACSTSCKLVLTILPRRSSLMISGGSSLRWSQVRVTFATKSDIGWPRRSLEKASKSLNWTKKRRRDVLFTGSLSLGCLSSTKQSFSTKNKRHTILLKSTFSKFNQVKRWRRGREGKTVETRQREVRRREVGRDN